MLPRWPEGARNLITVLAAGSPWVPTPALWVLLVAANVLSFWGAIRWGGNPKPTDRHRAVLAMGVGGAAELAAVLWLLVRYSGRL